MSECLICGRKSDDDFCEYHALAQNNIKIAFEDWKKAMEIEWEPYLLKLSEEENLGKFAREVIEYLMQPDDSSE